MNFEQNIYPTCNIAEYKTEQTSNQNQSNKQNNSNNNFLSTLLPLLLSGKTPDMTEILKKIGGNNPMFSQLFSAMQTKTPQQKKQKTTGTIDVSALTKVEK